jgi:glycosyltransferase involved in cell wall biosynthesis
LLLDDASACSVAFEQRQILVEEGGAFQLSMKGDIAHADVFLIIDIYDLENRTHPDGHVGWWRFPAEALGEHSFGRVHVRPDSFDVSIDNVANEDRWINEAFPYPRRTVISAVLRTKSANAIVATDHVPLIENALDLVKFRARYNRDWRVPQFLPPHFVPPLHRTIRIISQSVSLYDAVGNLCLSLFRMLRQNDVAVQMYAEQLDIDLNDIVHPVSVLASNIGKADYILYFFSAFDKHLQVVARLAVDRKIAYFHGLTPPKLLQVFDPEASASCKKAFEQLRELRHFDDLVANSRATAKDLVQGLADTNRRLEDIKIIPPCVISERPHTETSRPVGSGNARLLFVGRLKSSKRVEHVLQLFAAYRNICPAAECWIVGAASNEPYRAYLNWVEFSQLALPPGAVHWLGQVSDEKLQTLYHSASVYISMSEHEGFCLPVLEAMAAGLPVVAYAQPAIHEVLSGSGITFFDKDFHRVAAFLRALLDAPDRLAEIVARQRNRAAALMREADGLAFWRLLEPLGVLPASLTHSE